MADAARKEETKRAEPQLKEAPLKEASPVSKAKKDLLGLVVLGVVVINLASVVMLGVSLKKQWTAVAELKTQVEKVVALQVEKSESFYNNSLGKELVPENIGTLVPLESFLVNVASDQGPRFLQTQMELELSDSSVEDEVVRKKPAIRDAIIVLLSSRTYMELREAAGIRKLRQDVVRVINNVLTTGKIKEVYITQFHFN